MTGAERKQDQRPVGAGGFGVGGWPAFVDGNDVGEVLPSHDPTRSDPGLFLHRLGQLHRNGSDAFDHRLGRVAVFLHRLTFTLRGQSVKTRALKIGVVGGSFSSRVG